MCSTLARGVMQYSLRIKPSVGFLFVLLKSITVANLLFGVAINVVRFLRCLGSCPHVLSRHSFRFTCLLLWLSSSFSSSSLHRPSFFPRLLASVFFFYTRWCSTLFCLEETAQMTKTRSTQAPMPTENLLSVIRSKSFTRNMTTTTHPLLNCFAWYIITCLW